MLFLGSKKYPSPTYFVDYITKNNGKFNGFTDFDTTGFFFTINKDNFSKALDIFSQFFIDPLFDKQYVVKEVNSVNSEFERNIQLDRKRKEQVLRENANPKSLFHRFSTGNTKTLLEFTKNKNISLRDRVIEYYKKHYTIDNMRLVVYGNKHISEYKKLVEESFGKAPKPAKKYKFEDKRPLPYEFFKQGKLIFYQSINDHLQLDISIMIPDIHKSLPKNSCLYFKILLNKKGKNSLSDLLKKKGLLSTFHVGIRRTYDGFSMFKINGHLSSKGVQDLDLVLKTIYQYIERLKKYSLNKKIYNYYRKALVTRFQYNHRRPQIMHFMKNICVNIWKYPKKYLFALHSLLPAYNEKDLNDFSKHLSINNSVILIGHNKFDEGLLKKYHHFVKDFSFSNLKFKQEPWYNTKYSSHQLSDNFMKKVNNNAPKLKVEFLSQKLKPFPKHIL